MNAGICARVACPAAEHAQALVLSGTRDAPGRARAFVTRALVQVGCPATDSAKLVTSELVTNSVLHSRSAGQGGTVKLRLTITPGESVLVEVTDAGPAAPAPRRSPETVTDGTDVESLPEGGMGLPLIGVLALKWGSETGEEGTTYWALLPWTA